MMHNLQHLYTEEEYKQKYDKLLFKRYTVHTLTDPEDVTFLCAEFVLDEKYIREYFDFLDWFTICKYQNLSEQFIEEMCRRAATPWFLIAMTDNVSEDFIDKHFDKILATSKSNDEWMNYLNILRLFTNRPFSKKFFFKHYDCLNWYNILHIRSLDTDFFRKIYGKWIEELGFKEE